MSDPLNSKKIKIAIVAGEKSGDELGGPLMEALKMHFQDITFIGVGGEKMQAQGLIPLFPMDKLSVMGIIEPCLLYTSPSPRDRTRSRMPSSA